MLALLQRYLLPIAFGAGVLVGALTLGSAAPQPMGPAAWPPEHACACAMASSASARAVKRGSVLMGPCGASATAAALEGPSGLGPRPQPMGPFASRSAQV